MSDCIATYCRRSTILPRAVEDMRSCSAVLSARIQPSSGCVFHTTAASHTARSAAAAIDMRRRFLLRAFPLCRKPLHQGVDLSSSVAVPAAICRRGNGCSCQENGGIVPCQGVTYILRVCNLTTYPWLCGNFFGGHMAAVAGGSRWL